MLNIRIRQGKRGLWRWYAYKQGDYKCGSSIVGFDKREDAERDAVDVFGDTAYLQTDNGQLYAGSRDFSD